MSRSAGSDVSVLVVEDHTDQAEIVQRTLQRQGFQVTIAADGAACLEAVTRQSFSLILLDYRLPRMDGLQVLAELRARNVASAVVIMTAQGDERLAVEAMKAGSFDFIVKTTGYLASLPMVLRKVLKQQELATENERLHQETERRLHEAEALVELSRLLTSTLDVRALLGHVGQAAARICDMDRCAMFAHTAGCIRLLVAQRADGAVDYTGYEDFVDTEGQLVDELPLVAEAIHRRDAIVDDDVFALPLMSHDEVTGVLVLDRTARAGGIAAAQVIAGTTLASHVALALENARLYEQTEHTLAELRETQERLVRGETLRALGELASGAAHHLNNLLAVISGRAQMLLRSVDSEPLRRPLEIIDRTAHDGAEVVRRIQQFSRRHKLEAPEPVDVSQVMRDVVELTRARWHDSAIAQGVTIKVTCEPGRIPPVSGQAAALREVFTNLVMNSVDAMPMGGEIRLATCVEGTSVLLTVTDTGIGMAEDVRRRALDPFFTTKGVKSTGLGLSVNYGIVQQHGGEMTIASAPGEGTTVTVRLPAMEDVAPLAPTTTTPIGERHILVVDDEPDVREALVELLDGEGHVTVPAGDGAEALAILESAPLPDLVITDLGMPGMTGCELVRVIKARWPKLPVGIVTGWGDEPMPTRGRGATADFFLTKPLDLDRLLDVLARVSPRSAHSRA